MYPEGQKGAAKRAKSPEDRLVLHWEQNIKLDRTKRFAPQALDRTGYGKCAAGMIESNVLRRRHLIELVRVSAPLAYIQFAFINPVLGCSGPRKGTSYA